jgi:integrase
MLNAAESYFPSFEWRPPKFPRLKTDPGRTRVLSAEELAKIYTALRAPRIKWEPEKGKRQRETAFDLVRLALLIPARRSELLALTINDVNRDWNTITIHSTKTKSVRAIPLSSVAFQILKSRWPAKGKKFFPGYTPKQLITSLQKAIELSGVEYGDQIEGGYVFHDLRHTAATIMLTNGIDHATVAEILGHHSRDRTTRYIHPTLESQRKAIQVLEKFCLQISGFIEQGIEESREAMTG